MAIETEITPLRVIEDYLVIDKNHMDAIATSAQEQSVGLSEVNLAVNQMDPTTPAKRSHG